MKVLNYSLSLLLLCSLPSFAQEGGSLESYLSHNKQEQFRYDYAKSEAANAKLRDSWIAPLNLGYSYSRSNPYDSEQVAQNAYIKMDQPIFQSGGIYYGIKYAQASKLYSDYTIDVAKRKLIKETVSLLIQIKQSDLRIAKQELLIDNSRMNLEQKEEQYMSGQLDSSFLDSAVIEKNSVTTALFDLESAKERLISKFQVLSDSDYKTLEAPRLELMSSEAFMANNLIISQNESEIEKNRYAKNVTIAKYLPHISLTAGYNWSKSENSRFNSTMGSFSEEKDYYDYGVKATMPLDFNTFRDIESSRVDYLKSELVREDKKRELQALFEQVMQNIKNFDKKIALAKENQKLYEKLLLDTKELYEAGYKTSYDVATLQNSSKIQSYDVEIFTMDRALEILSLYEMYANEI
ncbi:MAG: TolC family protein [Epsilonproteobacteria bacterium]|nr:TolC family protein [Campylobacterota bacterium]